MGVVWTLSEGPLTFRDLQSRCETISPTVLNRRLKELQAAKLIRRSSGPGYCLTPEGEQLFAMLVPLGRWSKSWAKVLTEQRPGNDAPE